MVVLAGCSVPIPGQPSLPAFVQVAEARLGQALEQLGAERGLHYRGSFTVGGHDWDGLDLKMTASGVADGTVSQDGHKVRVLWLDANAVVIRADERYWTSHLRSSSGSDITRRAKDYAKRWVQVDADDLAQLGQALRPSVVARQFTQLVAETGVQNVASGVVGGEPASVMDVGDTRFHVSQSTPHRVLKIDDRPPFGTDVSQGDRLRGTAGVGAAQEADDGVQPGSMDASAVNNLYDGLEQQLAGEAFRNASDSRIQFSAQNDLGVQCPQLGGGVCTIRGTVTNSVSSGYGSVSGSVKASMQATASGPVNSGSCSAAATMPPNGSATMSCGVSLSVPTCIKRSGVCRWPVTVRAYFTAQAQLDVTRIGRDLDRKRTQDTRDQPGPQPRTPRVDCPGNSFLPGTAVLMADRTHKPIEDIRVGDLVVATNPWTRESGKRRVTDTITGHGRRTLVAISLDEDGSGRRIATIHATDGHPFWVAGANRWEDAIDLDAGEDLRTSDGGQVEVVSTVVSVRTATVHNLTIEDIHTYYVRSGAEDVLVHNSSAQQQGCGPPVSRQKQDEHVVGTPKYNERVKLRKDTSYFNSRAEAHAYAQHAWLNGTPVPGQPWKRDFDYGLPVGRGPNGGWQTTVRVHMNKLGRVHAHPKGPEY
jgi:hypothetical protein